MFKTLNENLLLNIYNSKTLTLEEKNILVNMVMTKDEGKIAEVVSELNDNLVRGIGYGLSIAGIATIVAQIYKNRKMMDRVRTVCAQAPNGEECRRYKTLASMWKKFNEYQYKYSKCVDEKGYKSPECVKLAHAFDKIEKDLGEYAKSININKYQYIPDEILNKKKK